MKPPILDKLLSRHVALEILYIISKGHSLKQAFECNEFIVLSDTVKPFVKFIVTQTIRYKNVFDAIINKYLQKKPQNKSLEFVYGILSLGACELLLSTQKPNMTLNSYTEITKLDKKTNHLSGIIRAILGKINTDTEILKPLFNDYKLVFGTDLYTHIATDYPDDIANICEWLLTEPMLDVLKLTDCPTPDGYKNLSPVCMRYSNGLRPENLAIFHDGDITIQSFASHLAMYCAGDIAGKTVLDLCSAPGGKTIQALANKAIVTAVDISKKRLEKLEQNLKRTGLVADVITSNALDYTSKTIYDIVLLDAPCSATGTIRKNPDIIQGFDIKNVLELQKLQKQLLAHSKTLVKPSGLLIYAVCSLSKAEGETQILEFIVQNPEFKIIKPCNADILPSKTVDNNHFIRLLPYYDSDNGGHDGFFIAYLKKEA